MARAARLKVYRTSAGFDDAYVAAPSQAAALNAWGARGDLFAIGEAEVVTDEALTAEPLACPGEVVRRPRGDMAAMLAATPKPKAVNEAAENGDKRKGRTDAPPPPELPPPPDRSDLDEAETALAHARDRLSHDLDALARERAELDRQEQRTRRDGEAELKRLERRRSEAERTFRKDGGEP